jgi:hypothetical protein
MHACMPRGGRREPFKEWGVFRTGTNRIHLFLFGMQNRTHQSRLSSMSHPGRIGCVTTETNRILLVLFGMRNEIFGPCSATT